jgi:hypothetical protein
MQEQLPRKRRSGVFQLRTLLGDRPCHNDKTGPAFDIQIVRRGILPEVLKRRYFMSNEDSGFSYELVIKFVQDENGQLTWFIQPDNSIVNTQHLSYEELASDGAPLAFMGIRALWEVLRENLVPLALDKANMYLWKDVCRRQAQQSLPGSDETKGEVDGDVVEGVVIH